MTGLESGFHKFSIRLMHDDNSWSFSQTRIFFINSQSEIAQNTLMSRGEYFFDTDPGIGNATAFAFIENDTF